MVFHALPHLSTREVGAVLESAVRRIARYLARRGLVRGPGDSVSHPSMTYLAGWLRRAVGYEKERRPVTPSVRAALSVVSAPRQQRLNFLPEPQGQGALRGSHARGLR